PATAPQGAPATAPQGAPATAPQGAPARDALSLNPALLTDDDRYILAASDKVVADVTAWLEKYRFQDAALAIYDFVWSKFCDWHVEGAKAALNSGDPERRAQALKILYFVLGRALRVLHPFMPFLTEELWHQMGFCAEGESIMRAPWPTPLPAAAKAAWGIDDATVAYVEAKRELITAGRALRTQYGVAPSKTVHFVVVPASDDAQDRLARDHASIAQFLRAEPLVIARDASVKGMPGTATALGAIHLPLAGLVDIPAELAKIDAELDKNRKFLAGVEAKLSNEGFVSRAPANVVGQQRRRKEELLAEIARLNGQAAALKEAE
ncbi:MAG: class I tRNA ligase family protein, partial [Kiritimatiellae bacterium]|nr:class I tRNA ligase family protein [Kiritimatiellia bacterium]